MYEYIISILALAIGYIIKERTKEELNQGKKYFKIIEIISLIVIIGLLSVNFNIILFIIGIITGIIFKEEYFYLGISITNILDGGLRFLHAIFIFVYGLAYTGMNHNKKIIYSAGLFLITLLLLIFKQDISMISAGALTSITAMKIYKF